MMRTFFRSALGVGSLLVAGSLAGLAVSFLFAQVFVTKLNIQVGTFGIVTYEDGYVLATKGYTGEWNTIEDIRVVQNYLLQEFGRRTTAVGDSVPRLRGVSIRKSRSVTIEVEANSPESATAYAQNIGQHLVDRHQVMLDDLIQTYSENHVSEIERELTALLGLSEGPTTRGEASSRQEKLIDAILEEYQALLARTQIYTESTEVVTEAYLILDSTIPRWIYMLFGAILMYLVYTLIFEARRIAAFIGTVIRVLLMQKGNTS